MEPVTELLARWPLIEPGGFATYQAAAAIFRQARRRDIAISTVDALLAALALEYRAEIFTLDRDFQRLVFTGLQLHWGKSRPQ